MPFSIAAYVFWIAPTLLYTCVVLMMQRRKLVRELPLFCSYAAFQVLSGCALYIILRQLGHRAYFSSYAAVEAVNLVLGVLVISELFSKIFENYDALQQLGWVLFRWAVVVLLGLAVLTVIAAPSHSSDYGLTVLNLMERSVRVIQAGLLLLLFLFTSYFGLSWKNYVFGIALGFGIFGSVLLAGTALLTADRMSIPVFRLVSGTADTCASLIWAAYMIAPARRKTSDLVPQCNLDEWNRVLLGLLNR